MEEHPGPAMNHVRHHHETCQENLQSNLSPQVQDADGLAGQCIMHPLFPVHINHRGIHSEGLLWSFPLQILIFSFYLGTNWASDIYATLSSPMDAGKKGGHTQVLPGPQIPCCFRNGGGLTGAGVDIVRPAASTLFVGKRRHPCRPRNWYHLLPTYSGSIVLLGLPMEDSSLWLVPDHPPSPLIVVPHPTTHPLP